MRSRYSLATALLLLSGCGYVGDPLPPALNIPSQVTDLRVVERGDKLVVRFTVPPLTTEGLTLKSLGEVDLRVGEWSGEFHEPSFRDRSQRVAAEATGPGAVEVAVPAQDWVGKPTMFAVWLENTRGRHSQMSNRVSLTPVPPLAVPAGVTADAVDAGVRVSWQPEAGRAGLKFQIFQQDEKGEFSTASDLVEGGNWIDTKTEYGKHYRYAVQAFAKAGEGEARSEMSPVTEVTPEDHFAPAVPAGLSAVNGLNSIELTWDRNHESDLQGYMLYRSVNGGPEERIVPLTDSLSYSDHAIQPGARYRYFISAIDRSGNESARSAAVEIVAP